jgi:hypothetical protein
MVSIAKLETKVYAAARGECGHNTRDPNLILIHVVGWPMLITPGTDHYPESYSFAYENRIFFALTTDDRSADFGGIKQNILKGLDCFWNGMAFL